MSLLSWSKWWSRASVRQAGAASKKACHRKVFLEALEDRTLLANFLVNLPGDAGVQSPTPPPGFAAAGDIRFCILQANASFNKGSTIQFDPTKTGPVIKLHDGTSTATLDLEIQQDMTILGPGAANLAISGTGSNGATRIFNITAQTATVTISGLTITDGNSKPDLRSTGSQGGDIANGGKLTLSNDVIQNGTTVDAIGALEAQGGGIFNSSGASLTVISTTIKNNTAQHRSNGNQSFVGAAGGGIYNSAGGSGQPAAILILSNGTQLTNNQALGGDGSPGGRDFDNSAGPGGRGGDGTPGGQARGGGVFNGGSLTIDGTAGQIMFLHNVALGGTGGAGGAGGNAGGGDFNGGNGGDGADGGAATGGGVFSTGTVVGITQAVFSVDATGTGNVAQGGAGGAGGKGGTASGAGNLPPPRPPPSSSRRPSAALVVSAETPWAGPFTTGQAL